MYLQHSDYDIERLMQSQPSGTYLRLETGAIRANDVALELLQSTPMDSFTKVQRTNLSNRLLQQLVNRKFGRSAIAEALHLLTDLVRMPSSSMIILKEPVWHSGPDTTRDIDSPITLFTLAGWLDDLSTEGYVPFPAVTELNGLASAVLEFVHYPVSTTRS